MLLFATVLSLTTLAQKGTVRGFVYNEKTGEEGMKGMRGSLGIVGIARE